MKRYFNSLAAGCAVCILLAACTTTHEAVAESTPVSAPSSESVRQSPEVTFAENLERKLQSGTVEEALGLFDTMPESLRKNTDLRVLKVSLLISAFIFSPFQKKVFI